MIYCVKSLILSPSVLSKSNLTQTHTHTLQQWWKIDVYLQVACCHLSLWWSSALNSCQLPSYTLTLKHTHLLLCLKAAQPHWGGHTHQDTVLLLLAVSTSSLSMSACTQEPAVAISMSVRRDGWRPAELVSSFLIGIKELFLHLFPCCDKSVKRF